MKEQTAEQIIDENLGGLELTMDDEMWKFYSDVIRQCMQSYSDQQNAELSERVKELGGLLTTWVKQNNYLRRHSISDFDDIHIQTKKALKK